MAGLAWAGNMKYDSQDYQDTWNTILVKIIYTVQHQPNNDKKELLKYSDMFIKPLKTLLLGHSESQQINLHLAKKTAKC